MSEPRKNMTKCSSGRQCGRHRAGGGVEEQKPPTSAKNELKFRGKATCVFRYSADRQDEIVAALYHIWLGYSGLSHCQAISEQSQIEQAALLSRIFSV